METQLMMHLQAHRLEEARELLQKNLASGELLDPRSDQQWAPMADSIATTIMATFGPDATISFWEALLDFFVHSIEPVWGHAHKGHIYFRLANPVARQDLARAIDLFEKAYREDILLEQAKGGTPAEVLRRSQHYSAYVALAILERIANDDFDNSGDRELFWDNLFNPSFDAAIKGGFVRPELLQEALTVLVPAPALVVCLPLYNELNQISTQNLPFATVSLTGAVLESLLLGILHHQEKIATLPNGRSIFKVELGSLLREAIVQGIFPTSTVQVAFQLVHIFRNRLHPGNELQQKFKLTARVSNTLKVFFELALLEWRKTLP